MRAQREGYSVNRNVNTTRNRREFWSTERSYGLPRNRQRRDEIAGQHRRQCVHDPFQHTPEIHGPQNGGHPNLRFLLLRGYLVDHSLLVQQDVRALVLLFILLLTAHRAAATRPREELAAVHAAHDAVVQLPPLLLAAQHVADVMAALRVARVCDESLEVIARLFPADVAEAGGEVQLQREAEEVVDLVPLAGEAIEREALQLEEEEGRGGGQHLRLLHAY